MELVVLELVEDVALAAVQVADDGSADIRAVVEQPQEFEGGGAIAPSFAAGMRW